MYRELQGFLWDTLEEWTLQENQLFEVYTHQERVFWHLIFCLKHTEESVLLNDNDIKNELSFLMKYLHNDELCPLDVIGIRP
ncbi:hypothetical protein [Agaribacter marinus]|uniref:Uncharacterized protein n=1 Tax=Agaribacter marinus TaxID=1431249 RepID=A0AA37WLS2_9ALTE|nr:hypothetical protein [Agaribacter marinus]GLR72395.1 hypothetical protein GCM10007852_33030 [Agaribacter marinus]